MGDRPDQGLLGAIRETMLAPVRASIQRALWGSGSRPQTTRPKAEPEARPVVRNDASRAEAGLRGREGGRPRRWSENPKYDKEAQDLALRLIAEGRSTREIADEVFGSTDRKYQRRIRRLREDI